MRADPIRTLARPALTFAAAFLIAFFLFRASDAVYTVLTAPREISLLLTAELPAAVLLLVTALAPFTRFCRPILAAGCVWRGASLGCLAACLSAGRLPGIRPVVAVLPACFAALIYLCLAAESDAAHPDLIAGGDARDHLKASLVLAGAHFLADLALLLSK